MNDEESNLFKLPKISSAKENSTPRSKIHYDILRFSQEKNKNENQLGKSKKSSSKFLTVP